MDKKNGPSFFCCIRTDDKWVKNLKKGFRILILTPKFYIHSTNRQY